VIQPIACRTKTGRSEKCHLARDEAAVLRSVSISVKRHGGFIGRHLPGRWAAPHEDRQSRDYHDVNDELIALTDDAKSETTAAA